MKTSSRQACADATAANFFWEGSQLGPVETGCIASFLKCGFRVSVYSYRNLRVPQGVELRDASEILPEASLGMYCQAGKKANLAAFSDAFRYNLLKQKGGWWFDADMLCIEEAQKFRTLLDQKQTDFCAAFEEGQLINGAALYAADRAVVDALMSDLSACGDTFDWGEIGPKLLTRVVTRLELSRSIEPPQTFYPIHFRDFTKLYDPAYREWCEAKITGSLAFHLWNEIRSRLAIPTTLMPPLGSFLHARLTVACAELKVVPTLTLETLSRLSDYPALEQQVNRLLGFEKRVKGSIPYQLRQQFLRMTRW
jgi:hypothetical protein